MVLLLVVGALGAGAGPARAQTPRERLAAARTLVRNGEYDSAMVRLNAVFQDARTTSAERSRAFLVQAAVLFMQENMAVSSQSRAMLRRALQADSSVRVDDELNTDVPGLLEPFEVLRREMYPPMAAMRPEAAALTVQPAMLQDTVLAAVGSRYAIAPHPSHRARTVVSLTRADAPGIVLWNDTLEADSAGALLWDLRTRDGAIVSPGRYALQVWAVDQAGVRSPTVERTLEVSRVVSDTQPLPPPLAPSAFEPETLRLKRGSPSVLLVGVGLAAAAALLPDMLARPELNDGRSSDATSFAIAGTAAMAGIVGFVAGHRVQPAPEAVRRNAELRQQDTLRRQAIERANAAAHANAPIRVRLEASGP